MRYVTKPLPTDGQNLPPQRPDQLKYNWPNGVCHTGKCRPPKQLLNLDRVGSPQAGVLLDELLKCLFCMLYSESGESDPVASRVAHRAWQHRNLVR